MRLFPRIFLGYLLVVVVTGVGVAVIAGLISPGLYQAQLDRVTLFLRPEFMRLRITLEESYQRTIVQALALALPAALALATGLAYLQTRRLVRGIRELAKGSRDIARGHYNRRLAFAGDDELGALAEDFNTMARALERAEQRRVELIGTVAHELKAPLAVQQGYAEALLDDLASPEEAARAVMNEVAAMRRLTNDLALLTQVEAGTSALQLAPHRPEDLVSDVTDRFLHAAEERGLTLAAEVAAGLPPVRADRERVGQVLGNLLSNALRYAPGSGRVVLHARPCEDCVEFAVADTGPGIPAEHAELVFRRFYRADRAPHDDGGTGIGLTIAQGLVRAHGGRIWLTSRVGEGTTVSFTLPAAGGAPVSRVAEHVLPVEGAHERQQHAEQRRGHEQPEKA